MIDEIWCRGVLEEWMEALTWMSGLLSLLPLSCQKKKRGWGGEGRRGLKLLFLRVRCGIIPNLFENINSMISGKQKGKGKTWELCKSLICPVVEYCVQFSSL